MTNFYRLESLKEFFIAFLCAILFSFWMPRDSVLLVQGFFIKVLSNIPINMLSILMANILSMIIILLLGIWKKEWVSFFMSLNGFALGIISFLYIGQWAILFTLLFPHAFLETGMIVFYGAEVKHLSLAYQQKNREQIKKSLIFIIGVCVPLLLISALLESK